MFPGLFALLFRFPTGFCSFVVLCFLSALRLCFVVCYFGFRVVLFGYVSLCGLFVTGGYWCCFWAVLCSGRVVICGCELGFVNFGLLVLDVWWVWLFWVSWLQVLFLLWILVLFAWYFDIYVGFTGDILLGSLILCRFWYLGWC